MRTSRFGLRVDPDRCVACERCATVCSHGNFRMVESKGKVFAQHHPSVCERCGACLMNCPANAIHVVGPKKAVDDVDGSRCTACERCVLVCPDHNLTIEFREERYVAQVIDKTVCHKDGYCSFVCITGALKRKP